MVNLSEPIEPSFIISTIVVILLLSVVGVLIVNKKAKKDKI